MDVWLNAQVDRMFASLKQRRAGNAPRHREQGSSMFHYYKAGQYKENE